jgi:hypothetical protein
MPPTNGDHPKTLARIPYTLLLLYLGKKGPPLDSKRDTLHAVMIQLPILL